MIKKLSLLLILIYFTGCRSGGTILRGSTDSLNDIKKAIVSTVGQPRSIADEGKEIISGYHDKNFEEAKENAKERYYSRISILGDRRPYDIQVEVFVETKVGNKKYELIGEDLRLAEKLSKKIKSALNQGRENKNVIDDFRPY